MELTSAYKSTRFYTHWVYVGQVHRAFGSDPVLVSKKQHNLSYGNNLTVITLCYPFLDINRAIELIDKLKGSKLIVKLVYICLRKCQ